MNSEEEQIAQIINTAKERGLKAPEKLSLVQWADKKRKLSSESSSEPGRWRTERVEVAREPMEAVTDPSVHTITIMACTQLLKTELINNAVGYFIDHDPSPILVVQPTFKLAATWSKDRLSPMIRDTPALRDKVSDAKSRDGSNTIEYKSFPGGHVTIVGANSPSNLASRPIKVVLCDEIDKYPLSAGKEGDVVALAEERAATFWNYKAIRTCSPTDEYSRIYSSYLESDQRKYKVPCQHCGHAQEMIFDNVKWEKDKHNRHLPETAAYQCESCGVLWSESDRLKSINEGFWEATAEFKGHAGFQVSKLVSPWRPLSELAKKFLQATNYLKRGDAELMKVFYNTQLAQIWTEESESLDSDSLESRVETYDSKLDNRIKALTAGVDVQADRIELEIAGWGSGYERWSIDWITLNGDPTQNAIWEELDIILLSKYEREDGYFLKIACTCVDSGFLTQHVYNYVRSRQGRRVHAIKGSSQTGIPVVPRKPSRKDGIGLYLIGVDTAKSVIFNTLKIHEEGEGYWHFGQHNTPEYFEQLTSEKLVGAYEKGVYVKRWKLIKGRRNEVLDLAVYNLAAVYMLNLNFDSMEKQFINEKNNIKNKTLKPRVMKHRR